MGQVLKLKSCRWAARWYELGPDGRRGRRQKGGFRTRSEARAWLDQHLDRLRMGGLYREEVALAEFVDRYLCAHSAVREPSTIQTLRERLKRPLEAFGDLTLTQLESMPLEIAEWRTTLPEGYAYAIVRSFNQVLNAAVEWRLIADNPVKTIWPKPGTQTGRDTTSRVAQRDRTGLLLSSVLYGAIAIFGAETRLRPCEWIALERSDVSRNDGVVLVRRSFARGSLKKYGKNRPVHTPCPADESSCLSA